MSESPQTRMMFSTDIAVLIEDIYRHILQKIFCAVLITF